MIRAAYLRVYVPINDIDAATRSGPTPAVEELVNVADYGLAAEPLRNDVLIASWEGQDYLCPRNPRLRMLEGLLAFRNAYPGLTGELLVPESVATRAATELEAMKRSNPGTRSHIVTSPWYVPLRWFAAFDPSEREVLKQDGSANLRYRTVLGKAAARMDRAVEILNEAGFHESVIEQLQDLAEWLAEFPTDALVELDYGTVAEFFSEGDLVMDESAADLQASVQALEAGDLDDAGTHYARAAGRWAAAQALTYLN